MEVRQLEYFVAVAEELHFGRAAARLHIAQPSVSEQVRRLERELGGQLFARTSRRVELTTLGQVFLPEARGVLAQLRRATELARRTARAQTQTLTVGYATDLAPRLLRLAAPLLLEACPDVQLLPQSISTPDQVDALRAQRLDVGLTWAPSLGSDLAAMLISQEPLVAALAVAHRLARRVELRTIDLEGISLILWNREINPRLYDQVTAALGDNGVPARAAHHAVGLDRMLPIVVSGAGVAITAAAVANATPSPGAVYRRFAPPTPTVDCTLVWRKADSSATTRAFVEVIRDLRDQGAFQSRATSLPAGAGDQ